jgi:hypothetical protein
VHASGLEVQARRELLHELLPVIYLPRRKLKYALIDAGSMEPTFFSPSEMDSIVLQDRQIASYAVTGLLVALVAERNVVFAFARMWEAFIEGIGWETKIFPSLAEAQDWVRIRAKEKFQVELS